MEKKKDKEEGEEKKEEKEAVERKGQREKKDRGKKNEKGEEIKKVWKKAGYRLKNPFGCAAKVSPDEVSILQDCFFHVIYTQSNSLDKICNNKESFVIFITRKVKSNCKCPAPTV